MNVTTLPSDKFQFSRLAMIGRYYAPALRLPIIIYPCVSVALGVVCYMLSQSYIGILFGGLLSMITSAMFYFFPLFFQRVSNPVVETLLPVTIGERLAFVAAVCLVLNPVLVFVPKFVVEQLMTYVLQPSEIQEAINELTTILYGGTYYLALSQSLPPLVTCMFVVLTSVRNTLGKAIGWTIATVVVLSVIGGVAGLIMALTDTSVFQDIADYGSSYEVGKSVGSAMADGFLRPLVYICAGISTVYTIFMLWLAYRKLKRTQI